MRGIFRDLSEAEERDVARVKALDEVMGTVVEMQYCASLHITAPSVPVQSIMEDPKSNVHVGASSYPTATELPGGFKKGARPGFVSAVACFSPD